MDLILSVALILAVPVWMILRENKQHKKRKKIERAVAEYIKKKPWYN